MDDDEFDDPIVAEVRAIRDRHAAQFDYDLDAIFEDLLAWQRASGRTYVRYPPRPWPPVEPGDTPEQPAAG